MDKTTAGLPGVGRGRGNATNVPERQLIEQVKERPLLYDKSLKDYRKPGVSDAAWNDVAVALDTSVSNCKKRWKSLRDTFIKYYRLEVLYSEGESRRKHKQWNFYQDLLFLKQHVELFRLEDSVKENQDMSDGDKCYTIEEENSSKEVYEIKLADEEYEDETAYRIKEHHLENYEEDITYEEELEEKTNDLEFGNYEIEDETEELTEVVEEAPSAPSKSSLPKTENSPSVFVTQAGTSSPIKNIVDPDERYLMSCLPAFKRFTPQQKAYVRMGIERLFYEVEFEDVSEPKNKKTRSG